MNERGDLMRRRYEQFSGGDVEGATAEWADDFVWRGAASEALPGGGEAKGREQAIARLGQAVAAWEEFNLTVESMVEDGDTVVALGHYTMRSDRGSATIPFAHVWRWRGEESVAVEVLTDTFRSAQLLGLA